MNPGNHKTKTPPTTELHHHRPGTGTAGGRSGLIVRPPTGQSGAALIVGLILLTALTLLSLAGMRNAQLQERMAGNFRDRGLAFQGAEAALREAETYLRRTDPPPFDGSVPGLIDRLASPGSTAYWNRYDWARAFRPVGASLPGLAEPPRYVIEALASIPADAGGGSGPSPALEVFRITARATAAGGTARVVLQSTFGVATGGDPGTGRRSWRQLR